MVYMINEMFDHKYVSIGIRIYLKALLFSTWL